MILIFFLSLLILHVVPYQLNQEIGLGLEIHVHIFAADHACVKRNGDCSHFCFPVPYTGGVERLGRKCACPFGMKLNEDMRTCQQDEEVFKEEKCRAGFFTCDNKRCVPTTFTCDQENDCLDNSDEKNCTGGLLLYKAE